MQWGFDKAFIATYLKAFDFLTVIKRERVIVGVEWIRHSVRSDKKVKKKVRDLFDSFLDEYFKPAWSRSICSPCGISIPITTIGTRKCK